MGKWAKPLISLSRYFITPVQQAKYNNKIASSCWRECGKPYANVQHIFWSCPVLQIFWEKVQKEISYILRYAVQLNKDYMILGRTIDTPHEENDNCLLRVLRITALKQITRNWFQTPPTTEKWRDTTQQVHQMEYITDKMRGNLRLYEIRWAKWSTYYS